MSGLPDHIEITMRQIKINLPIYSQVKYYLLEILISITQCNFTKVGTSIVNLTCEFHNESQPVHYSFAYLKGTVVQ